MTKPVTIPNTFATATTAIPLSNLDADFSTVATALNDANTYSNYAPDTGSANAYVVTLSGVSTTYSAGLRIQFKAGNANTTASTLNVNGGGAKNITYQDATAIASGTIAANSIVDVMYDGTQFLLMNDPAGATGGDVVGPSSATDNAIVRFDGTTGKLVQNSVVTIADSTGDISGVGQLNATTVDATNIEVTNIKAKDGTAAASIADSTGVISITSNPILSGGTANGVLYLNGSKMATSGSALTFDGTTLTAPTINAASLVVSRSTGWNQSADTYTTTVSGVTDVHTSMRRCLLRDDGSVNYYLDASNSTLKADGSAATLTGADGMVMVEIPAFYVKFTSGATRTWSISLLPSPGYTLHPAFMKDGEFVPYRYYGAYDACVNSTGTTYESGLNYDNNWGSGQQWSLDASPKLASVSGVYPAVGITRANARTLAANRGTGWRLVDAYLAWAVELLFLIEFGTFRTQQTIGDGNVAVSTGYPASSGNQTDSPHSVAGKSNSIGNASTNTTNGASSGTRDTAFMSYRGIENWYGNCWNWIDGYNINNNQAYVSNTRANFADDTATNYNAIGAAMVASDGWVTNCQNEPFAFLPSAVGGSSSTYWADYYYQAAGWRVALFGGAANNGANAGGFCWNLSYDSSDLNRSVGARLAF